MEEHYLEKTSKYLGNNSSLLKVLKEEKFDNSSAIMEEYNVMQYIKEELELPEHGEIIASKSIDTHNANANAMPKLECVVCNKMYSSKKQLKKHVTNIHTNRELYTCNHCGKSLKTLYSLNKHVLSHLEDREYHCKKCDKTFRKYRGLKQHSRAHSEIKRFKCDQCSKAFKLGSHLDEHLRMHSGTKPFKCDQCGKACTTASNLKKHLVVHSEFKPFQCSLCNKEFKCTSNLRQHLNKVHLTSISHTTPVSENEDILITL